MKVVYSSQALNDLRRAAAFTRRTFGDRVAAVLEARIRVAIAQLQEARKRPTN